MGQPAPGGVPGHRGGDDHVMLFLIVTLNGLAILVRNRLSRNIQW